MTNEEYSERIGIIKMEGSLRRKVIRLRVAGERTM